MFGYDGQKNIFMKLADRGRLSHAYLLYGEPGVGKFLFAHSLAHYLEHGSFESDRPLQETFILDLSRLVGEEESSRESIGIQQIKDMQQFLYQSPQASAYRVAIIRDGEWLTDQAQNALLKILEEPPIHACIIITALDPSVLLPPVSSRLQRVFFPVLDEQQVLDFINKNDIILPDKHIDQILGRIGRVRALTEDSTSAQTARELARRSLQEKTDTGREKLVDDIIAYADKHPLNLSRYTEELALLLRGFDVQFPALRQLCVFMRLMQMYSISRRVHLKNILWRIR